MRGGRAVEAGMPALSPVLTTLNAMRRPVTDVSCVLQSCSLVHKLNKRLSLNLVIDDQSKKSH